MLVKVVVQVAEQMDEAPLLWTFDGVVSCVKIRNQHPFEVLEKHLHPIALSTLRVNVGNLIQTCENPDEAVVATHANLCFIRVK